MNLVPANLVMQITISADEDHLANGQFLACGSKIADFPPTDTKLGSTILMQSTRGPRGQISSVSFSVSCSRNAAINASYTSSRLVKSIVISPDQRRKQKESDTKRYLAGKIIGEWSLVF